MGNIAVSMKEIVKVYPNGVLANHGVNFDIQKGEIHALVGENGAGKSTLMKILFGIEQSTSGKIIVNDKEVSITSVTNAIELGLGMVQQHFMLVPSMTVAENILLGLEVTKGIVIDKEKAIEVTKELCQKYSFAIDVNTKIKNLSVGDKQKVEILKVLYREANVIILDEPTAVLTPQETEELFKQLKILKELGRTIVFISHKLREIKEICDRITVMVKGTTVGTYNLSDLNVEDISNLMMGQNSVLSVNKEKQKIGAVKLKIRNLSSRNSDGKKTLDNVSFSLREGEVLGVVGIEGNGQRELVEMITGHSHPSAGSIKIQDEEISRFSTQKIRDRNVTYIPQERMSAGVALNLNLYENLFSTHFNKNEYNKFGVLNLKKMEKICLEKINEFKVKADNSKTKIKMLSGGNIQKIVVAREFMNNPEIIVAEDPTRGIDVGAANLIHNKLVSFRSQGKSVLMISSDITEILSICDSLIVLYNGRIVAYFPKVEGLSENELGLYMLGIKKQSEEDIRGCVYE